MNPTRLPIFIGVVVVTAVVSAACFLVHRQRVAADDARMRERIAGLKEELHYANTRVAAAKRTLRDAVAAYDDRGAKAGATSEEDLRHDVEQAVNDAVERYIDAHSWKAVLAGAESRPPPVYEPRVFRDSLFDDNPTLGQIVERIEKE